MIDGRISLARTDLAPAPCEGIERALSYGKLRRTRACLAVTSLLSAPDPGATQVSQLLFGERFDVLREEGGFAWGQARRDGYVGWTDTQALRRAVEEPTHWVRAPRAAVHARAEIRAPCLDILGMNALCRVVQTNGAFSEVDGLGWVATTQLAPIGFGFRKPTEAVAAFLGAPYVWGARDGAGLDCSGLVQQSLHAAGRACPRDADQQATLGVEVAPESLRAGDLVGWRGHIGMMLDAERVIHANAHHMAVAIEPLPTAIARIERSGTGAPTAYRRPGLSPPAGGSLSS